MCSERDSPLEPFVLPAPGQPELARLTCGAHLGPSVLTRKQKCPRVNSLVCDRAAAFCAAGPPEVLSRMSRPVTQAAKRKRELTRARSQRLKQAAWSLTGEPVSRGFAGRGALEGYLSHYTSLVQHSIKLCSVTCDRRHATGDSRHILSFVARQKINVCSVTCDTINSFHTKMTSIELSQDELIIASAAFITYQYSANQKENGDGSSTLYINKDKHVGHLCHLAEWVVRRNV